MRPLPATPQRRRNCLHPTRCSRIWRFIRVSTGGHERYLTRGLSLLPYGPGASVAHVAGGDRGGGYEWNAALSASPLVRGNTALELDEGGNIVRLATIYDSFEFPDAVYQSLVILSAERQRTIPAQAGPGCREAAVLPLGPVPPFIHTT